MSPTVFLAPIGEGDESEQRSLYFGNDRGGNDWHDHYGIWSCRFSADGKELVAGGSGKIMGKLSNHGGRRVCSLSIQFMIYKRTGEQPRLRHTERMSTLAVGLIRAVTF